MDVVLEYSVASGGRQIVPLSLESISSIRLYLDYVMNNVVNPVWSESIDDIANFEPGLIVDFDPA